MKCLCVAPPTDVVSVDWDIALQTAVLNLRVVWSEHIWRAENLIKSIETLGSHDWSEEFFFCLLGGYGITFESNRAAFSLLKSKGYLSRSWFKKSIDHEAHIADLLRSTSLNDPLRPGRTFRYRFPNSKARSITRAAKWVSETLGWNFNYLLEIKPPEARDVLITCPNVGYKTASWFLRNVGYGSGLSIIDIHIERIAKQWAIVPYGMTAQRDYLEMEERLLYVCSLVPAPIEIIDLILWQYSRGDLINHETGQARLF